MGPTHCCHRVAACLAFASATAAAILLWGVGAESVHFGNYIQGGFLLANAFVVTTLESLTALQYVEWRRALRQASECAKVAEGSLPAPLRRALVALDEYRRAAVYAALSVPCLVRAGQVWLPLVPGAVLLLSSAMYMCKYCCTLQRQRAMIKVPTFVRFKDESVSAEVREVAPSGVSDGATSAASTATAAAGLSHQSSFASSHSGRSVQMGSRDSGIEASQREVLAEAQAPRRKAAKGLARANSSSPDRCCLISEDSLSLRE